MGAISNAKNYEFEVIFEGMVRAFSIQVLVWIDKWERPKVSSSNSGSQNICIKYESYDGLETPVWVIVTYQLEQYEYRQIFHDFI